MAGTGAVLDHDGRGLRAGLARLAPSLGAIAVALALPLALLALQQPLRTIFSYGLLHPWLWFELTRTGYLLRSYVDYIFIVGALALLLIGIGLFARWNAVRWAGAAMIVLMVGLYVYFPELMMQMRLPRGTKLLPLLWMLPALLLLFMGPLRRTVPGRRDVTWPSRIVGTLLLYNGVAVLGLLAASGRVRWTANWDDINFLAAWLIYAGFPIVFGLATMAAGFGVALHRRWAPGLVALLAVAGIIVMNLLWLPVEFAPQFGRIGIIVHVVLFAVALIYLARRKPPPQAREDGPIAVDRTMDPAVTIPPGAGWHDALRNVLSDAGLRPARPNFALSLLMFFAVLVFIALPLIFIQQSVFGSSLFRNLLTPEIRGYIAGLAGALVLLVVYPLARHFGRQTALARAKSAEQELAQANGRRPILYLRSFGLDRLVARPTFWEIMLGGRAIDNAETILTKWLRKLGPVIAIGRPGDAMPPIGAARFYATDETWRDKVANCAAAAQLVVWTTGTSPGLAWEIDYLLRNVPREKLVIWAHPHLLRISRREREAEWARFRETLGALFPHPFPERLGRTRFFLLDADGRPVPSPSPWWHWRVLLTLPLRGTLEAARQNQATRVVQRTMLGRAPA